MVREIKTLITDKLPDEIVDASISVNIDAVTDIQIIDRKIPIWITNYKGKNLDYTSEQLGVTGVYNLLDYSQLFTRYDSSTKTLDAFKAQDIWVDNSETKCDLCENTISGIEYFESDYKTDDYFICSSCNHRNERWKYGTPGAGPTIEVLYSSPFKQISFVDVELFPNFIYDGSIFINEFNVEEFTSYDNINPIIYIKNKKGAPISFRPSKIGAKSSILLKTGRRIFTKIDYAELKNIFIIDSGSGGGGTGGNYEVGLRYV